MKSTLKPLEKEIKPEYPCLKIREDVGLVIFFISKRRGIIVHSGDGDDPIGLYAEHWAEDKYFTPFTGTIELSND